MTYTITFSHVVEDKRVPLYIDGREATLQVEASSRTGAIYHAETKAFCEEHNCSVRGVSP